MVTHLSYRSRTLNRGLRTSLANFGANQSGSRAVMSDTFSDTYMQTDDITPLRTTGFNSIASTLVSRRFCP